MNDFIWIGPALIFGLIAVRLGLPPMIGYLSGGFLLHLFVDGNSTQLAMIGDLGVTLLLFTIGLKLNIRALLKPSIWGTASLHMISTTTLFTVLVLLMRFTNIPLFSVSPGTALLIGFALSFSSTVFAVKHLGEQGELYARHGVISIGILIIQDFFAILFLSLCTGNTPSPWSFALLLLIPLRPILMKFISSAGKGELMTMLGLALAFGFAALFKMLDLKGDLGALIAGALVASHPHAHSIYKKLSSFKDLLLVGFFLSIGMSGDISWQSVWVALALTLVLTAKVFLYFFYLSKFRMRARTSVMSSMALANYSEFGLIVGAIAYRSGWLQGDWIIILALALSLSFIIAIPLNKKSRNIYAKNKDKLQRFESAKLLPEDSKIDTGKAEILIVGMASIGKSAYDTLEERYGQTVIGVDANPEVVDDHCKKSRNVILADATNEEFWARVSLTHVRIILVAVHDLETTLCVVRQSNHLGLTRYAVTDYPDQAEQLEAEGVVKAWSLKAESGVQFAESVCEFHNVENESQSSPIA